MNEPVPCPACGGAGGGPMGRAGSAWDDEEYVCPRCEGAGAVALPRPGVVKASPEPVAEPKRKATG